MDKEGKQTQWRVRRNSWIHEKPSASQRKASLSVHSLASRWMTEQEVWCNRCQEVSRMGTLPFRWSFLLQTHLCSCRAFTNRNYRSLVKYCLPLPNLLLLCLPSSTLELILPFSFLVRVLYISLGLGWHLTRRKSTQNSSMGLREKSWPADGYISWDCNLPVCKSRSRAEPWWDDASFSPWLREL